MTNGFCHKIHELMKPKNSMGSSFYIMGVLFSNWKQY